MPLAVTVDEVALQAMIREAVQADLDARDLTGDVAVGVGRAAEMLDCGAGLIRGLVDRGVLPVVPSMGSRVLIPVQAIKAHAMKGTAT